jgi:hypothetical protein
MQPLFFFLEYAGELRIIVLSREKSITTHPHRLHVLKASGKEALRKSIQL